MVQEEERGTRMHFFNLQPIILARSRYKENQEPSLCPTDILMSSKMIINTVKVHLKLRQQKLSRQILTLTFDVEKIIVARKLNSI